MRGSGFLKEERAIEPLSTDNAQICDRSSKSTSKHQKTLVPATYSSRAAEERDGQVEDNATAEMRQRGARTTIRALLEALSPFSLLLKMASNGSNGGGS